MVLRKEEAGMAKYRKKRLAPGDVTPYNGWDRRHANGIADTQYDHGRLPPPAG